LGEGGEVELEEVVAVEFAPTAEQALVAGGEFLDDFGGLLLVELFLQVFIADVLAPEFAGRGGIRGQAACLRSVPKRSLPVNSK